MPINREKVEMIRGYLKDEYDTGDENEFAESMKDATFRENAFNAMKKGYDLDVDDFDEFTNILGYGADTSMTAPRVTNKKGLTNPGYVLGNNLQQANQQKREQMVRNAAEGAQPGAAVQPGQKRMFGPSYEEFRQGYDEYQRRQAAGGAQTRTAVNESEEAGTGEVEAGTGFGVNSPEYQRWLLQQRAKGMMSGVSSMQGQWSERQTDASFGESARRQYTQERFEQQNQEGLMRAAGRLAAQRLNEKGVNAIRETVGRVFDEMNADAQQAIVNQSQNMGPDAAAHMILNSRMYLDPQSVIEKVVNGIDEEKINEIFSEYYGKDFGELDENQQKEAMNMLQEMVWQSLGEKYQTKDAMSYIYGSMMSNNLISRLTQAVSSRKVLDQMAQERYGKSYNELVEEDERLKDEVAMRMYGQTMDDLDEKQQQIVNERANQQYDIKSDALAQEYQSRTTAGMFQSGLSQYEAGLSGVKGMLVKGTAGAATMVADGLPFMVAGAAGGLAARGATGLMINGALRGVGGTLERAVITQGVINAAKTQVINGAISSGLTFGLYDAASAGVTSYASGNYSWGDVVWAGAKGFGKGALLGSMNTSLKLAGGKLVGGMTGKAGVAARVGESAFRYGTEVAFFSALEQIEKNGFTWEDFDWASVGEQAVLIGLLRAKEHIKNPMEVIDRWKKPITSKLGMSLTDEEIQTLVDMGYGRKSRSVTDWVNSMFELKVDAATGESKRGDLQGAMLDGQVPLEIRRKLLYGYGVVTPEAVAWSVSEPVETTNEAGNKSWTVTSYTENSKPIAMRKFASKKEAETWAENIKNGQIGNHVRMLEQTAGAHDKMVMKALYDLSQETGYPLKQLIKSFNAVMNGKGTSAEQAIIREAVTRANANVEEQRNTIVEQARKEASWDDSLLETMQKDPEQWTAEEREKMEAYRSALRRVNDKASLDSRVQTINHITTEDGKVVQAMDMDGNPVFVNNGIVVKDNGEIDFEAVENNGKKGAVLVYDQNGENPRWVHVSELSEWNVNNDPASIKQGMMETYDPEYGAQAGNIVTLRFRTRRDDGVTVDEEKTYKVMYVGEDGAVRLDAVDGSGEHDSTVDEIQSTYMTIQAEQAMAHRNEMMSKPVTEEELNRQSTAPIGWAGNAEEPVTEEAERPQLSTAAQEEELEPGALAESGRKVSFYPTDADVDADAVEATYLGPDYANPGKHKVQGADGKVHSVYAEDIVMPKAVETSADTQGTVADGTDANVMGTVAEGPVVDATATVDEGAQPSTAVQAEQPGAGMPLNAKGKPDPVGNGVTPERALQYFEQERGMEPDVVKEMVNGQVQKAADDIEKYAKKRPDPAKMDADDYMDAFEQWKRGGMALREVENRWKAIAEAINARERVAAEEARRQAEAVRAAEEAAKEEERQKAIEETKRREQAHREFMEALERKKQDAELEEQQAAEAMTEDEQAELAVAEEKMKRENQAISKRLEDVSREIDLDQPADEAMAAQVAFLSGRGGGMKITPESIRAELGSNFGKFGKEGLLGITASKEKGGRTIAEIAEIADAIADAAGMVDGQPRLDANVVRSELINCIMEGKMATMEALERRVGIGMERPEDRPEYWTPERIAEYEDAQMDDAFGGWNAKTSAKAQGTVAGTEPGTVAERVAEASAEVNTSPTEAQKEAGNYKKGHVRVDGMEISIEQPKGSVRKGVDADGNEWETEMQNTYGYIRGAIGKDGDHIDVFLSDTPEQGRVFVVDQVDPKTGEFDEHKVMYGFNSMGEAIEAYLSNYEEGWQGFGNITEVNKAAFKVWLQSSKRKTKPFADYKLVTAENAKMEKDNVPEELRPLDEVPFHAAEGADAPAGKVDVAKATEVAKSLGLHVSLMQQDPVDGADAMIDSNGLVKVNFNSPKGAGWLISHESGHRMERLAPEAYKAYKEAALGMMTPEEVQARIEAKRKAYRSMGLEKSDEQLRGEIVNDMMGDIFAEPGKIDELIKNSNPTVWRGIMNAIEDMWAMLTGKSKENAYQVYKKLRDALRESRAAYKKEMSDTLERIETKLARLNHSEAVFESSISKDGNLSSGGSHVDDGTRFSSGAQKDGAKIRKDFVNRKDLTEKMAGFIKKMSESDEITTANWHNKLMNELGFETHEGQNSQYFSFMTPDGRLVSVRMSGHPTQARNYKKQAGDEHYSIVVQVENWDGRDHMKTSDKIRLHEYHYAFPDKERLVDITKSLFGLVDEGKYADFAWADTQGESPRQGGEPFMFAQISDENYRQIIKQIANSELHVDEKAAAISRMQQLRMKGEEMVEKTLSADQLHGVELSIREKEEPKKKGIGYKVFYRNPKDGKLYPPMVANPGGADTPVGVWLDADAAPIVGQTKTGRNQVKAGGKGTQGGSGQLAYRPGWHLGEIPYALQFGRLNPETGKKDLFPKDFVWAEVEYAADKDYQEEAYQAGINANGKYQHSLAGLPHLPEDGYYRYRTNPNPETDPWIITGAMKVNRVLSNEEVDDLVRKAGREPQKREGAGAHTSANAQGTVSDGSQPSTAVRDEDAVERRGRWSIDARQNGEVRFREYEGENEQLKKASEEHMKAVENGDMETAQMLVDEAAKAAGYTIHAYHGTNRADRVGTEFKPERATSGPMSFFTDNKGIADNYAKNKKDTSMAYDGDWDAGDYHTQFKVNVGGYAGEVRMENAWGYLPYELRNEITKKAMQVTTDDMGNIITEEGNTRGTGGYDWNLKQRRGNAIKALVDEWLDSGNLYNKEGQFMEVLEKAGVLEAFEKMGWKDARYLDPNYSEPKTYDTYLKIEKPFDTNEMYTEKFVDRLENWWNRLSKKKQAELTKESMDADHWDKNSKTIEQWVEDARYDLAHGETWAWTVIPDALTEYLKSKGYDGIIDRGGKGGGTGHNVFIPFYPEQIKSAEAVTRDAEGKVIPLSERFDTSNKDIRYRDYEGEDPLVKEFMSYTPEQKQENMAKLEEYDKADRFLRYNAGYQQYLVEEQRSKARVTKGMREMLEKYGDDDVMRPKIEAMLEDIVNKPETTEEQYNKLVADNKAKKEELQDFYDHQKAMQKAYSDMIDRETQERIAEREKARMAQKPERYQHEWTDEEKAENEDYRKKAKKHFGTTQNFAEAGYILTDGSLLDFTGRHEYKGKDSSFLAGHRQVDHREIAQAEGLSTNMNDFIAHGNVRILPESGTINLSAMPTASQLKKIKEFVRYQGGDVSIEFSKVNGDSEHYVEYDAASGARIAADITRYYQEGLKPQNVKKYRRGEGAKPTVSREEVTTAANDMADKLHKEVKVCQNADEISDESVKAAVKKAEAAGKTPTRKGWFNTRTGEIEVYAPAAENVEDVQKTVLHETVGHYGLRELLSENEQDYNNAMVEMYRLMNDNQKKEVQKLMSERKYDVATAMDEYLAKMAEDRGNMVEPGFWQKAKSVVKNLLRKIGIDVELTDGDLKYLLWSSHEALKNSREVTNADGSKSRVYDRTTMDQKAADWAMRWHNDVLGLRSKWEAERKAAGRGTEAAAQAEANVSEEQARKAAQEAVKNRDTDPDDDPTTPGGGGSSSPTGGRRRSLEEMLEYEARQFQDEYSKMKAEDDPRALAERVRAFIRNRMTPLAGKRMTVADINSLLRDVDYAITHKTKKGLERALDRAQALINQAESLAEIEEMMNALNTRTTTVDKKGMVKGVLVDETANEVLNNIKMSYKQMLETSYDDRMSEVRREMRALKAEYGITRQDDPAAPEEFRTKLNELKGKLSELKEKRDAMQGQQVNETVDTIRELEDQLREDISKMTVDEDGNAVAPNEEKMKAAEQLAMALPVRRQLAELRQMMQAKSAIQRDLDQTSSPAERQRLEREMDMMQRRITLTSREIKEELKDIIGQGRDRRAALVKADIERQQEIVRMGCRAVRDKEVPDTLDKKNNATFWDSLSSKAGAARDMWQSPIFSFNFMAKYIDHNNAMGDGDFYTYFMKGEHGALKANNEMSKGIRESGEAIDAKSQEIFGKSIDKVMAEAAKVTNRKIYKLKADKSVPEEEWMQKDERMTKGQMLYAWLTWRQEAGRVKMQADGWTQRSIREMEEQLGPEMLEFGKWVTDEYLKQLRDDKYNVTYEKVMGTSMHKANHYFPLRIDKVGIADKSEVGQDGSINLLPSASSGNLIVRTTNRLPVDLSNDAFEVLQDYIRTMERWNAMAELTKDLNTLIKSPAFRNLMEANHEGLFDRWKDACAVATGSYKSKRDDIDKFFGTPTSGFMAQAIRFGWYTAIKQSLSQPAFWFYSSDPKYWAGWNLINATPITAYHNYKWAKENLPAFAERVAANDFGIEGINDKTWIDFVARRFAQGGMWANKMVDACTVANGARAIYEYDRRRFKKMKNEDGSRKFTDEQAEEMAKVNAQIAFNESQQSSRNEFSAPIQKDRGIMQRSTVAFQNSNIGYRRMFIEGLEDIVRKEGDKTRGFLKVATVGILNATWYMGLNPALSYQMLTGNADDDEKNEFMKGVITSIALGYLTNGTLLGPAMTAWASEFKTFNPVAVFDMLNQKIGDAQKAFQKNNLGGITWAIVDNALKFGGVNLEKFDGMYNGVVNALKRGEVKADDIFSILNMARTQRREFAMNDAEDKTLTEYMDDVLRADKKVLSPDDRARAWWGGDAYNKLAKDEQINEIIKNYQREKLPEFAPMHDELEDMRKAFEKEMETRKKDLPKVKTGNASKTKKIKEENLDVLRQQVMDEMFGDDPEKLERFKRYQNTVIGRVPKKKKDGTPDIGKDGRPKTEPVTYKKRFDDLTKAMKDALKAYDGSEESAKNVDEAAAELIELEEKMMNNLK